MTQTPNAPSSEVREQQINQSLESVRAALAGLNFGSISLTVHEGRVVQIDVTEKRRFVTR